MGDEDGSLRLSIFLQAEWDTYRTHKRQYVIILYNATIMVSSLTFLLARVNSENPFYPTFGPTAILSAATVEWLMETSTFATLSLVDSEEVEASKFEKVKTLLGLGTGVLLVNDKGDSQSWPDSVRQAAAKRRNILTSPPASSTTLATLPPNGHTSLIKPLQYYSMLPLILSCRLPIRL